jgi:hypothetical protein
MPLAEANHSFVSVIHSDVIIQSLSQSSIQMPLAEANHSFFPIIHSDALAEANQPLHLAI